MKSAIIIILTYFVICFVGWSYKKSLDIKTEKEEMIKTMKAENCVLVEVTQTSEYLKNQYVYNCDGGKKYTLTEDLLREGEGKDK